MKKDPKKNLGRPVSGRGAYLRVYLNRDKLKVFDEAAQLAGKDRQTFLRDLVEQHIAVGYLET